MKKIYLLFTALMISGFVWGQTDVRLQINHMLGTSPFQFSTAAANNNNVAFNVTRLQYYISQITIFHDGGQEILVPNTWFLVNASTGLNELLGSFNVSNVEGIRFGIGVEAAVNHDDPALWPSNHPLAPKSPSMHWGWNAGYRFVCMEGYAGSGFSQNYQIHALEDDYYYLTTVTTTGIPSGNEIVIALNADYEEALRDVDVSNGPITHGGFGESISLLQNFRDHVFTPSTTVDVDQALAAEMNFAVYPNPATANRMVKIAGDFPLGSEIVVTDLTGKIINNIPASASSLSMRDLSPGYYMVALRENGTTLAARKLLILE